jgi:hypothetical protein
VLAESFQRARHRASLGTIVVLAASLLSGCVSDPYVFGQDLEGDLSLDLRSGEVQVERGRPNAFVDGLGHYLFSLPSKLLLLSWRANNHDISPETEASLREYLDANGLCRVKVRLNQYAPGGEWSRLARNREMPAGWRWTLGLLTVAFYTILPDRLFAGLIGGDHYNPYTNTISLYSDLRPVALHEAGHSRDFAEKKNRHWKGGYAALRLLPLVPLWQEGVATGDAIAWERSYGGSKDEKSAYRTLYPAYGSYIGGEVGRWYGGAWLPLAAAVPGHIAGWVRSAPVEDRERPDAPASLQQALRSQGCEGTPLEDTGGSDVEPWHPPELPAPHEGLDAPQDDPGGPSPGEANF